MSAVLQAIIDHARRTPDADALRGETGALSWVELRDRIDRLAARVAREAPGAGPVAIALDNGPDWVVADLALVQLGRPALPLPPSFTPGQTTAALQGVGAQAVISAYDGALVITPRAATPVTLHAGTAKITFTSGSTGTPKGACLSQAQMEAVAQSLVQVLGAEYAGVHMAVLPLAVLLENVAGLYAVLLAGGVYQASPLAAVGFAQPFRPDYAALASAAASSTASSLILTPELLRGLIAAKTAMGLSLPALRLVAVGGAKVSPRLLAASRAAGLPVVEGYGLSECASVVALNTPADNRPSVGKVLPHIALTIADDGEILIHQGAFLGYAGGPSHAGPLATGDLGALDADGFLSLSGRKSNLLITAFGRNVSPEWVESELLAQPQIAQAMVFGDGAARLAALVVPTSPTADVASGIAAANAALPEYARVEGWAAVPPFDPAKGQLTANGRPRRAALMAAHAATVQTLEEQACPSLTA